jgi:methylated-DNA-[protein]-cysteine S-methyltransferase
MSGGAPHAALVAFCHHAGMVKDAPVHVAYRIAGWGIGELVLVAGRVVYSEHPRTRHSEPPNLLDPRACDPDSDDPGERLVSSLGRFFAGEPVTWSADELRLDETLDGESPFTRALARELCAVPYGERVSYGELAERAGRPRAARAAGTFCANNQLGVLVPCHRVVRSDGSLGEYGGLGIRYKRRLLQMESRVREVAS